MNVRDLGGHSGCKILLCEKEDNQAFVRKISGNIEYNLRLKLQAKKQGEFNCRKIKAPRVLQTGYTKEGLFYFDMEYIQGITMAEYMNTIEIGKVKEIVESIIADVIPENNENPEVEEKIFRDKILSLKEKISYRNNTIIYDALDLLSNYSWGNFTKSICHGDMTLENIIVKNGQLYLIDFLDSFYDCWILDVSTLLQDVQALWSYRFQQEININTLIRLKVFRDILMDEVKKKTEKSVMDVYYALLLKLIRIYPYTKDEKTYEFLNEKTKMVLGIIRDGRLFG